jgi:hypothetical protein
MKGRAYPMKSTLPLAASITALFSHVLAYCLNQSAVRFTVVARTIVSVINFRTSASKKFVISLGAWITSNFLALRFLLRDILIRSVINYLIAEILLFTYREFWSITNGR